MVAENMLRTFDVEYVISEKNGFDRDCDLLHNMRASWDEQPSNI